MGSFEYLVYFNVLEGVAAQHGLRLVTDYADAGLDRLFEQVGVVARTDGWWGALHAG